MIRAIILDIDNTLLAYNQEKIEQSCVDSITLAKEKGIKIIIATGRGFSFMQQDVKDSLKPDYFVCVNGACINDALGNIIYQYPMKQENVLALNKYCDENNYSYGYKYGNDLLVERNYSYFVEHYATKAIKKENIHDDTISKSYFEKYGYPLGTYIFNLQGIKDEKVESLFPNLRFHFGNNGGFECIEKQVNKAEAIEMVLDKLGIDFSECISFGDSGNDKEMIEKCGIGVAMGNGKEALKQVSDYVTSNINEDGIYKALKYFNII